MKKWCLLVFLLLSLIVSTPAKAVTIDFESVPDSSLVGSFYPGITFQNALALTAGFSLNEIDFPPHSGEVAIGAADDAPLMITFANPVSDLSVYFSLFNTGLNFTAKDANGATIGPPQTYYFPAQLNGVVPLGFTDVKELTVDGGDNFGYILDDLIFTATSSSPDSNPVPEPSTFVLLGVGFLVAYLKCQRRSANG